MVEASLARSVVRGAASGAHVLALLHDRLNFLEEVAFGGGGVVLRVVVLVQNPLADVLAALHHAVDHVQILCWALAKMVGVVLG